MMAAKTKKQQAARDEIVRRFINKQRKRDGKDPIRGETEYWTCTNEELAELAVSR